MKILATCVLTLLPSLAVAQDISIRMAEIPAGSWLVMNEAGRDTSHVFRGKKGRYYVYEMVPGANPNGEVAFTDLRDASGNNVKRTFANGNVVTYKPHNCQRVVGQCSFTESGRKGDGSKYSTKMVRVNTPKGKGFTFNQVAIAADGTQVPIRSGQVKELDKMGALVRAKMTTHSDKKTRSYKKRKASWD